jgi:hypothetical protein
MAERADAQAVQQLREEHAASWAKPGPVRDTLLDWLLNRFAGDERRSIRAAILLAYEAGYDDGGSSTEADLHEDNPEAVRRCYELLGQALRLDTEGSP